MAATVIHGAGDVRVEAVPDPVLGEPTDGTVDGREPQPRDPRVPVLVYTAEPDTPTVQALDFLASWAATRHVTEESGRVGE